MRLNLIRLLNKGRSHFLFLLATITASGVHFLFSIYVKAKIEPLEYGIYSTCMILQTYLFYLQLGSLNAFNRDYPQLVGAGDHGEAKRYRDTVFSFLILVFLLAILAVAVVCGLIAARGQEDLRYLAGYLFCGVVTALTAVENFGNYRSRIDGGFSYVSAVTLLELLPCLAGIFILSYAGYYGIYLTSILSMMVGICLYYRRSYADISFKIDLGLLRKILWSGAPLLVNGLIWTVVNSIDKFVILGFMDTESLGLYGIAQNAFTYMVLIPSSLSQLFYVEMGKVYGARKKEEELVKKAGTYSSLLAALTSVISLTAFYYIPILVKAFMPGYAGGTAAAQILAVGLSIYAATMVNGNILTILKRNAQILRSSVYMCVFNAVCSVGLVVLLGTGIEMVALGTAVSYMLCGFIIMLQVNRCTGWGLWSMMRKTILPILATILPGVLLYFVIDGKVAGYLFSMTITAAFYAVFYGKDLMGVLRKD